MKYLIILAALIACDTQKVRIVKVDSTACIKQCAWNPWVGGVYSEKIPECSRLLLKAPCCAFQFTNSGSNPDTSWAEGQIGATTTCPPEVK